MVRRGCGKKDVRLLSCINPVKDRWRIRWDIHEVEDTGIVEYMEEDFDHKPAAEEVREVVFGWYNKQTDTAILSGFNYKDMPVWLSSENQFNYKSAYDLAVQTGGGMLPVTFKFGRDTESHYHTFETLEDLTDFYTKVVKHIQDALADGWKKKDAFDLEEYRIE